MPPGKKEKQSNYLMASMGIKKEQGINGKWDDRTYQKAGIPRVITENTRQAKWKEDT